jgi:nucleoside-diphosphate-sugar epimerase
VARPAAERAHDLAARPRVAGLHDVSRVLVTGASGFVGRHAVDALARRGHEVWARRVDLHDPAAREAAVREARADSLLHLAWYAEHGRFWTSTENVRWVESSLALLRAFAEAGGRRAVLAGTCAEYDWSDPPERLVEAQARVAPATLYGAAKHGLHTVARAYARQTGLSLAWGRIFFTFGPGEPAGRIVPSVALRLLAGEPAPVTSGEQLRDFLAVEQLGDAFAALVGSDVDGAVNVASGRAVALRDVVAELAGVIGRPELVRFGALEQRPGEPERLVADVRRLREEVGWTPGESLRDGLARTVAWWREQQASGAAQAAQAASRGART